MFGKIKVNVIPFIPGSYSQKCACFIWSIVFVFHKVIGMPVSPGIRNKDELVIIMSLICEGHDRNLFWNEKHSKT